MKSLRIAGVDEVGRGPLVGAVVAAAVILDPEQPIYGLNDSKKLSEKKRELLYEEIMQKALAVSIGQVSAQMIDTHNILQATMMAMQQAVTGLSILPDKVLVDGNQCPNLPMPTEAIIQGDGLVDEISAASIIAKVTRDKQMAVLDTQYPQYGFAKHKGYPTKLHLQAIKTHGILDEHRKTFKPVAKLVAMA